MDRNDLIVMFISGVLSVIAYVSANDKPEIQHIEFDEPAVITVSLAR